MAPGENGGIGGDDPDGMTGIMDMLPPPALQKTRPLHSPAEIRHGTDPTEERNSHSGRRTRTRSASSFAG
jgi:hypothetical protein